MLIRKAVLEDSLIITAKGDLFRQTMTYAPRFTSFHLSTAGITKYVNN
jgi:hypothetical protein